jgi:hypothetical protein
MQIINENTDRTIMIIIEIILSNRSHIPSLTIGDMYMCKIMNMQTVGKPQAVWQILEILHVLSIDIHTFIKFRFGDRRYRYKISCQNKGKKSNIACNIHEIIHLQIFRFDCHLFHRTVIYKIIGVLWKTQTSK